VLCVDKVRDSFSIRKRSRSENDGGEGKEEWTVGKLRG
jgi:hypothetical protein